MINNFEDYIEAKDLEEQDDSQTLEDYSAYELLQYIFQDCYFFFNEFRAIKTEGNKDVIQIFHSISEKDLPFDELARYNSEGFNIHFGPAIRKEEKGNKESVYEVSVLPVDIDLHEGESKQTLEQQLDNRIKETGLTPSVIVDSGNGIHLYFKLRKNIKIFTDDDIQLVEGASRWLAEMFGGDNICDISRVMRLPGFNNNKDPQSPKKCTVMKFNKDALYDLSDFGTIPKSQSNMEKIELGEIPNEIPKRFFDLLESDELLNKTWLGQREDLTDNTGSGYDMALGSILRNKGFSKEEIARIWDDAPYEKKNNRTIRYKEHTLSKIFSDEESMEIISESISHEPDLFDFALKEEDFNTTSMEYLIEDFFPKNSLMLITSKYGVGKSILALAIAKTLILQDFVVVIVDADMSLNVIGSRLEDAEV